MCRLLERGKCQKKSTKGVIFLEPMEILAFLNEKHGLRCVIIHRVVCLRKEQLCELERRVSVIAALNWNLSVFEIDYPQDDQLSLR